MCDQVLESNKRIFINYLFPMVIQLLVDIEKIVTDLNNKTYQDRITVEEEQRKGKTVNVHSVIPLTKEQIKNELDSHNLSMIISFIKEGLKQINHQTIGIDEMFECLENVYIETYYFKGCCENCNDIGLYIIDIIGAMRISMVIGYGKPEKYNNIFAFLAFHTLNLFDLLGV